LAELEKLQKTIGKFHTTIAILSSDDPKQSSSFKTEKSFAFQLLCDTDRQVIKLYNLLNPHEHGGIAYPAIFVIKPGGAIGYRSLDKTAKRVDLSSVVAYLETVNSDIEALHRSESDKHIVLPTGSDLLQVTKNLIFRGNAADWKHYIGYPLQLVRMLFRKI